MTRDPMASLLDLDDPDACERFAQNADRLDREDLARLARKRALQLRAQNYGARTPAEREAVEAILAYEETLRIKNGKRTTAARTWQMVKRHGLLAAVERAVLRETETMGYNALIGMGLEEFAFEAVILRHPESFSTAAVTQSRKRLNSLQRSPVT